MKLFPPTDEDASETDVYELVEWSFAELVAGVLLYYVRQTELYRCFEAISARLQTVFAGHT
jgi:hypothetical protein